MVKRRSRGVNWMYCSFPSRHNLWTVRREVCKNSDASLTVSNFSRFPLRSGCSNKPFPPCPSHTLYLTPDFPRCAGRVVYVPSHRVKNFFRRLTDLQKNTPCFRLVYQIAISLRPPTLFAALAIASTTLTCSLANFNSRLSVHLAAVRRSPRK